MDLTKLAANVAAALGGRTDTAFVQGVLTSSCAQVGLGWDGLRAGPGMAYRACICSPDVEGRVGVLFVDDTGLVFVEEQIPADPLLAARYLVLTLALALQQAQEQERTLQKAATHGTMPFGEWLGRLVTSACYGQTYGPEDTEVDRFLASTKGVVLTA